LLAIIHLIAFASFWVQLDGLVGANGLLPAQRYFEAVREHYGPAAWWQLPSLCWVFGTGTFLSVLGAGGVIVSILLFIGIAPALCLVLLWSGYLSLSAAGQIFLGFQWDTLLLETTLLAVLLAPWSLTPFWRPHEPSRPARLLLWWLLFRLMFLAGVVKLASGDSTWRNLSALTFHYETQPLPTPLAWHVHQLPAAWHRAMCAGMFALELLVPFFLFAPRILRHNAALLLAGFMAVIALTGNYTFFNLLTLALCLLCLDNQFWLQALPRWRGKPVPTLLPAASAAGRWQRRTVIPFAAFAFAYTALAAVPLVFRDLDTGPALASLTRVVAPFRSLNTYGLFAVMTNPRPELIFEGSSDGREWRAYELPHKPGSLARRPTWVAPHQPRLDWQLWFAALGPPERNRWVIALCEHLLRGTPEVLALFATNPFPDQPPRSVRVVRYEYHFTDAAARASTGQWWRRSPTDVYVPAASLR
jgi:hypothetical protein